MTHLRRVGIRGTGSYLPVRVLSNDDLARMVDTSDDWITTRTGIKSRRIAAEGETTSDLAIVAARNALNAAGMKAEEIDLVIVATVTGDFRFPATACRVQASLGAGHAGAFDVSAACSGFLYALSVGCAQIAAGAAENILLVGAETLSKVVDYGDRTSCILFGDGAGAVILSTQFERGEVLDCKLFADGSGYDIMWIKSGGSAFPVTSEVLLAREQFMRIRGREVYKFAVNRFVELVQDQIDRHPSLEIGLVIPHQVNQRIIESAVEKLALAPGIVYSNIDRYGNTSAASIPIALDEAIRGGVLADKVGKLIVFCAFGAGLTWASGALKW